jgi:glycosyltransferase involved in cell wall biosynthesis
MLNGETTKSTELKPSSPEAPALRLSVVVPTRNRAAHAAECVASILTNPALLELILVDQSDSNETKLALAEVRDSRFRYVATDTRGVTNARNVGIDLSQGELVAFTDDDCRVPSNWAETIIAVFAADADAVLVCGRVKVPEELWDRGFTESFEPKEREWVGRYPPFGQDWGITANMSMRRDAVQKLGAFDPFLGAGSPLRSGGEPDLIFRVLKAGLKVVNASEVVVDHLGVRPYGEAAAKLLRGYGFGTGAALFKHVRMGDTAAIGLYLRFFQQNVARIGGSLWRHGRPTGLGYLLGFISGAAASYKFGIDRERRQYVKR